jgi:hypothetical protein
VPTGISVVVHVAILEEMVTAEQPVIDVPLTVKFTVPVAPVVTVAVSVIDWPYVDVVAETLRETVEVVPACTAMSDSDVEFVPPKGEAPMLDLRECEKHFGGCGNTSYFRKVGCVNINCYHLSLYKNNYSKVVYIIIFSIKSYQLHGVQLLTGATLLKHVLSYIFL